MEHLMKSIIKLLRRFAFFIKTSFVKLFRQIKSLFGFVRDVKAFFQRNHVKILTTMTLSWLFAPICVFCGIFFTLLTFNFKFLLFICVFGYVGLVFIIYIWCEIFSFFLNRTGKQKKIKDIIPNFQVNLDESNLIDISDSSFNEK